MKRIGVYVIVVLIITIIIPTVIVKAFNFVPREDVAVGLEDDKEIYEEIVEVPIKRIEGDILNKSIKIYNQDLDEVIEIDIDEYVKGVVAAEMPAAFHIEALKAQAVAARTYVISRNIRYANGHPDHPQAPICSSIHCQAYLSFQQLGEIHGEAWIEEYWPKIVEAVESTRNLGIFYGEEIIEPLYHSTSGGRTEDSKDVFASELPYLKSVSSPYETDAPKYSSKVTLTIVEFIDKIKSKYPHVDINSENIEKKIKLIDKTTTGRVKKIAIGENILDGSDLRELFALNSTNFTIYLDKKLNIIEIDTLGYGHGVGMSQWGANGMGKQGSNFEEILKHYYTDVEIRQLQE